MKRSTVILAAILIGVTTVLFLFLYYFVLTTTRSEESALKLVHPKTEAADTSTYPAGASHLLLVDQEKVFVYEDKAIERGQWMPYTGVRAYLNERRQANPDVYVIITPFEKASYKNTVDILDEMTIGSIKNFVMVDPTEKQVSFVANTR